MKLIAFHPAARDELLEAAVHYEEQASDLGAQFTVEVYVARPGEGASAVRNASGR